MHVAHLRGIVHRDLKPGNVLLASGGREPPDSGSGGSHPPLAGVEPKISDFGLAKRLEGEGQTYSRSVLGAPSYLAPEQAGGKPQDVGPYTDVYALGAVLYECLTGRPPFHGRSVVETLALVQTEEVVPPSRGVKGKMPRDLETICLKCLQKNPARRYASA